MRWALVLLSAALLVVAALVVGEIFRGFEFSDRYSVFRGGRDGAKALWLTFERLGVPVTRLHESPRTAELRGVLFVLLDEDGSTGFPSADGEELLDWAAEGNTLVVAHAGRVPLLASLGVSATWAEAAEEGEASYRVGRADAVARFAGLGAATFRAPAGYRFDRGNAAVLLEGPRGPAALVLPRGAGRVVLLSDPWPLSNAGVAEPGNLELALFLAGFGRGSEGTVAFDELHHGFAADRSIVGWLRRRGLAWVLVQGALALALAVLAVRGRGGVVAREAEPHGPGSGDFLSAMARLYAGAGLAADAARDLAAHLEQRLRREGGRHARPIGEPLAALAHSDPALAREVADALQRGQGGAGLGRGAALVAYHNEVMALDRRLAEVGWGTVSRGARRSRC